MIILGADQNQGRLVHIGINIAVWLYLDKKGEPVCPEHGRRLCNGSASVSRTVSAADPAGCNFQNIVCITYRGQRAAVAERNSAGVLQRVCKCQNFSDLDVKSFGIAAGLSCHPYRCIPLRQGNCSIVRDDGCIVRRPADGVSVKVYGRKRQLCGFFHCRRKFHAVPEVLLIPGSDLLICQCGTVDAAAVQVAFVIFPACPVCLTDIEYSGISQDLRKAEVTGHAAPIIIAVCSFLSVQINGCSIFRKYHIYMYPVTSRLCDSRLCTRICLVIPFNLRCASRLRQDSDVSLLKIFLDVCIRRGIHHPVPGVCQIRLCVIGYRDLLLPCQKTSAFQIRYIQIAGAIQIQSISAVCFLNCRCAFLCRLSLPALKTGFRVIKCKLCQQRKLFCSVHCQRCSRHQSAYHRSRKERSNYFFPN